MTSYELRDYPRAVSELKQALSDARRPPIAAGAGAVVLFVIEGDQETEQTSLALSPGGVSLSGQF
jgi:hypothetical protein